MELSLPRMGKTPMQLRNGRWYKREDLLRFSNGVNGKVRTTLYLAQHARDHGYTGLVYGGSVLAPALGRVASAAAFMGMDCRLVIGAGLETAIRHPTVAVAHEAGAAFLRNSVAYNPALQKRAREFARDAAGYFQVPYGVSTPPGWTMGQVRDFLEQDAPQVHSLLAADIETLVIPFGSGNATAGVLYGLATRGHGALKRVVLVGVGGDSREWLNKQLVSVGVTKPPFEIVYLPTGVPYAKKQPEHRDGIDFHPTYEGKAIRYLDQLARPWWTARDGKTCFWIVGGPL